MAYVAPIHKPSSVRHALKLQLLESGEDCLVVAKANRIEVWATAEDGLILRHSKAVFGKVTILNKFRPQASSLDHLFVGTSRFHYFTLSWNAATKQLETLQAFTDIGENAARPSQTGDRSHIDPSGKFLVVEMLEGIITTIPIVQRGPPEQIGTLGDPLPTRIAQLCVKASAFLQPRSRSPKELPKLAVVFEDSFLKLQLQVLELRHSPAGRNDPGSVDFETDGTMHEVGVGACDVIPLDDPFGGLIVLGETSISYFNDLTNETTTEPLQEAAIFVAWCRIDSQRYVLADEYGSLFLLFLNFADDATLQGWTLEKVGVTSRASCLTYLDEGRIHVGSHEGDSRIIQLRPKAFESVQNFSNIAPILDFTIMDMGNRTGQGQTNEYSSGQARIVTGSGAWQDGSLRSVRSGVSLQDVGTIVDIEGITNIFSISSQLTTMSYGVDTLIVTTAVETRVFCIGDDGAIEEVDSFAALDLDQPTLAIFTLRDGRIVHVTRSMVKVSQIDNGVTLAEWQPDQNQAITESSFNDRALLLALDGNEVVMLEPFGSLSIISRAGFPDLGQIACVELPSALPDIALLGFWTDSTVAVVKSTDLSVLYTFSAAEEDGFSIPRSLLITQIFPRSSPTLFIATTDGSVVTYLIDPESFRISYRKSTILGTQQAVFKVLPRGQGLNSVFALSEHPSLIYASEDRLVFSAVTAEKATSVCSFDSNPFPDHIAVATENDLRLALVDRERTTHVQTLVMNETVRRVAHTPALKAFGLGTIKRSLIDSTEVIESFFTLVDEISFGEEARFALNEDEIVESVMRCELSDGAGGLAERFVVGTATLEQAGQGDATKGRFVILEVTDDRQLKVVAEMGLRGACRCLAMSQGRIVAAQMKSVAVYAYEHKPGNRPELTKKAAFTTATAPLDIDVTGDIIAVADLMKSLSLLKHTVEGQQDQLTEVARHYQTIWSTALANVGENLYLESDAEDNLLLLRRDVDGVTGDDQKRLKVDAEINLGEMVNRIRGVDVVSSADAVVVPRAFLGTVEGSIYVFGLINSRYVNVLMELQDQLADQVQSPGGIPFRPWRAYRSQVVQSEAPVRFVDGEFLERFLDCPRQLQEEIVQKVKGMVSAVDKTIATRDLGWFRELVEGLRRLH